jgi:hypothetical protein
VKNLQDGEVSELADLRRDANLRVLGSQVTGQDGRCRLTADALTPSTPHRLPHKSSDSGTFFMCNCSNSVTVVYNMHETHAGLPAEKM